MPTAVVFGHADGDGYLAAEVTRENLLTDGWVVIEVVVDPKKTANYNFWINHFQEWDFSYVDLVVVVDIAFDLKDPIRSCEALSCCAADVPDTKFVVIDHHSCGCITPWEPIHLEWLGGSSTNVLKMKTARLQRKRSTPLFWDKQHTTPRHNFNSCTRNYTAANSLANVQRPINRPLDRRSGSTSRVALT